MPKSEEEADRNLMKRVEANDPVALRIVGKRRYMEDYKSAFEFLSKRQLNKVTWQRIIVYRRCIGRGGCREGQEIGIAPFGSGCNWWS
jgi:hypothetical protein